MNKIFTLLLLLSFSVGGYGQVKTVYFDIKDKATTDSTKAVTYAVYGKVSGDSLFLFKKYDMDGYLTVSGSFKDEALSIPEGKFVYYNWIDPSKTELGYKAVSAGKDRYKILSGNYVNGLRQGRWLSFYENGEVKNVVTFDKGLMHGEFKSFDERGMLLESGQFVNDQMDGEWETEGGKVLVTYQGGKKISSVKNTKKKVN